MNIFQRRNPFEELTRILAAFQGLDPDAPKKRVRRAKKDDGPMRVVGIDGEGHDTPDGRHIYTYLAAVDEHGALVADAYDPEGLTHDACCEMLLSIPRNCLCFGFMFSYDVTKIVEALPAADRYMLMRPQARDETICLRCDPPRRCPSGPCPECGEHEDVKNRTRPVEYGGRMYDYFNGSLTIRQGKRETKVWDCFRFFGCSFVEALKLWKVGTPEEVAEIFAMKNKRGALENEDPEDVRNYCKKECHLLGVMMRQLIDAHEKAGIPLKRYDGAGSTASALLRANDVATYKGTKHKDLDPELAHAVECSFFGGRFEDSVVGLVAAPVYGFDISSAYPFAQTHLPCLSCGSWRRVEGATIETLEEHQVAVASFRVRRQSAADRRKLAWGPLPFRDEKGSIAYGVNFSGWAWGPELLAALRGWPDFVELVGVAYVYETPCGHRPFHYVPAGYRQRLAWGKEGRGLVLKLGLNAGYGKTAQSIGDDPPFQSWVWAGMTTATTRGQLLDAIALASDRWNVLAVATDGIVSLEKLPIREAPRPTGTEDLPKPLGGWELKDEESGNASFPEGMMIVKPGLYWRLQPEMKDIRARGIGRREAFRERELIQQMFLKWDRADPKYYVAVESRRFFGAKHSIYGRTRCATCKTSWPGVPGQKCPKCGGEEAAFTTSMIEDAQGKSVYGTWGAREVRIGFDPYPKRERTGLSRAGTWSKLRVRDLEGKTSAPYDVGSAKTTPEGLVARSAREIALDQPDYDPGFGRGEDQL